MSNSYESTNGTTEYSKCPRCGGRYVYHSFMVSDGLDDVTWDNDQFCLDCNGLVETNTEYGMIKPEENRSSSIIL